jgi:dTDP-4-dehydrorhamnose 3,5-epimerase
VRIASLSIPGLRIIQPIRLEDDRGWFSETYRKDLLAEADIHDEFVQDNQSFSARAGTIRGLHFQVAPFAQAKIVRVLKGAILDVAVDLRRSSPTFLKHVAVRLDAITDEQLYVPVGFGHAFCTLEDATVISYKVSATYSAACDRVVRWNDPDLGIPWPVTEDRAILSPKDSTAPMIAESDALFN